MSADDEATSARVRAHLDTLGEPYKVIEIDPAYADTASFCERYGYSLEESVNCILVAAKTGPKRYAACLVQATRRLDVNRTVRRPTSSPAEHHRRRGSVAARRAARVSVVRTGRMRS